MKKIMLVVIAVLLYACNSSSILIEAEVMKANAKCPMEAGNGLTLSKVSNEGFYIIYCLEGKEGVHYFNQSMVTDELRQQTIEALKLNMKAEVQFAKFVDALKSEGIGIIYHYYVPGENGSSMDVVIESSQL